MVSVWYRYIGNSALQCIGCQKWVHRKCSGIMSSIYKVMKSFVCRGCVNPVTSTGCTVGVNANLELVVVVVVVVTVVVLSIHCPSSTEVQ